MAANTQRISTIVEARKRRIAMPHYLRLDGSRYLLGLVLILALMSLIVLAQTGAVATQGYSISTLQSEKDDLLRERSQLLVRQASAQSLEQISKRAQEIGLRPMSADQVRYMNIPESPEHP